MIKEKAEKEQRLKEEEEHKIFQAKLEADEAEIKKEKEIKLKIQEQLAIQKKVDEENRRKIEEEIKLL